MFQTFIMQVIAYKVASYLWLRACSASCTAPAPQTPSPSGPRAPSRMCLAGPPSFQHVYKNTSEMLRKGCNPHFPPTSSQISDCVLQVNIHESCTTQGQLILFCLICGIPVKRLSINIDREIPEVKIREPLYFIPKYVTPILSYSPFPSDPAWSYPIPCP